MAYEKQTWNCGDTITAEKMNHIEEGIEAASSGGGAGLVIEANGVEGTCNGNAYYEYDVSYNAVVDALESAKPIYFQTPDNRRNTVLWVSASYQEGVVYLVNVTYLFDVLGQTATFEVVQLYSDTADGNMRNYDCWGGNSEQSQS